MNLKQLEEILFEKIKEVTNTSDLTKEQALILVNEGKIVIECYDKVYKKIYVIWYLPIYKQVSFDINYYEFC